MKWITETKEHCKEWRQWFPASKEVEDTKVIKQGVGVCFLGQRWNFAYRLPGEGCNHEAKYYVALVDKLKQ
jgi:hypothetical protein